MCRSTFNLQSAVVHASHTHPTRFELRIGQCHIVVKAESRAGRDGWIKAIREHMAECGPESRDRALLSFSQRSGVSSGNCHQPVARVWSADLATRLRSGSMASLLPDPEGGLAAITALIETTQNQADDLQRQAASIPQARGLHGQIDAIGASLAAAVAMLRTVHERQGEAEDDRYSRLVEGPDCILGEEEFYDAIEQTLACQEQDEHEREHRRISRTVTMRRRSLVEMDLAASMYREVINSAVTSAVELVDSDASAAWTVVHKEKGMVVSRTDCEVDGQLVDRSKTVCEVEGVSAKELAHFFFALESKKRFDCSVETVDVLDELDDATYVCHMYHKRVWPTAQRDSCMANHIRSLKDGRWVTVSESVSHEAAVSGKCVVRTDGHIALIARSTGDTRETVRTYVEYVASVNPGGWAPPAVVRAVSKREYPKILRKLGEECRRENEGKPLDL
jgi:collagen type IV alpha-3-binding protein